MCGQTAALQTPAEPAPAQTGADIFSNEAWQRAFKQLSDSHALKGSSVPLGTFTNAGQFRQWPELRAVAVPSLLRAQNDVCAARLLEAPLPEETEFAMPIHRRAGKTESMPEANLPAPACPKQKR